jgi:hypothetical protein
VWGFTKWLGRVSLWIVFLPLGLWRSIRHGRRKSEQRLLEAMRAEQERRP